MEIKSEELTQLISFLEIVNKNPIVWEPYINQEALVQAIKDYGPS